MDRSVAYHTISNNLYWELFNIVTHTSHFIWSVVFARSGPYSYSSNFCLAALVLAFLMIIIHPFSVLYWVFFTQEHNIFIAQQLMFKSHGKLPSQTLFPTCYFLDLLVISSLHTRHAFITIIFSYFSQKTPKEISLMQVIHGSFSLSNEREDHFYVYTPDGEEIKMSAAV